MSAPPQEWSVSVFERARPRLTGRAFRMLGVLADADDVVQDAWLRWERVDRTTIANPDAWLNTTVARLALDRLRARTREQDRYLGPWLPTPLVERSVDPGELAELSDTLTTAFLLLLEHLSPDERAAFLLADVFGERFEDVAAAMGRSIEACRQLASRGRRKLRDAQAGRNDVQHEARAVAESFLVALATGDAATALACLAPDAVYLGDGGPDHRAARRPVVQPERIVRLLANLYRRLDDRHEFEPARVGGAPGLVIRSAGRTVTTIALEVRDGLIVRITTVRNPVKLEGIDRGRAPIE